MANSSGTDWIDPIHKLGKDFRERAAEHDRDDSFVKENYAALKKHRFLTAAIPKELGGASHAGKASDAYCKGGVTAGVLVT